MTNDCSNNLLLSCSLDKKRRPVCQAAARRVCAQVVQPFSAQTSRLQDLRGLLESEDKRVVYVTMDFTPVSLQGLFCETNSPDPKLLGSCMASGLK